MKISDAPAAEAFGSQHSPMRRRLADRALRLGQPQEALGYKLTFQGMQHAKDGKDHAMIAVASVLALSAIVTR